MAFSEVHLTQTNALKKMTSFTALVPEGKKGPFPVLYLLHGMSDDHTTWMRRTSIEQYVYALPLIVIMPNCDRSFYTNAVGWQTCQYETFMTSELIAFVDEAFRTISSREGRAIAGNSMGGYGAMKLALKFPELYCACVSYSGGLLAASRSETPDWSPSEEWKTIFGISPAGGDNDILALSRRIDRAKLPALWIDCGTEDFLIEDNREVHRHLENLGIPHEYVEKPGSHSWEFWDDALVRTMHWITTALGIDEPAA